MITIKNKIFTGKKAQAAMEFLTTYGWAILILIIVIVALANLGIFRSPQTPNSCSVSAPFACSDVIVKDTISPAGGLYPTNITIKANNVGTFSVGTFTPTSGSCSGTATLIGASFNGNGDNRISLPCATAPITGNKEIGELELIYTIAGAGVPHTTVLKFSATVEDDGDGIAG